MKNYIFVDENNVVQICSAGGKITGGIEVDNIPAEVWSCPQKYKYIDGVYADNPDYVAPSEPIGDIALLRAQIEAETDRREFIEDCITEMAAAIYE